MYGTSMMRSLALNNGGTYFSDNAGNGAVNVTPKEDHPFARFTMPRSETLKSSLIDYLEMPANVEWQGNEVDSQYTFLNDAYNIISEGFIKGQEAVQNCIGYDGWKNVEAIKELSSDIKNINNRIADNTEDIGAILKTIRSDTKGMNEDVSYVRTNGLYVKR